jgi:hypothetical protein
MWFRTEKLPIVIKDVTHDVNVFVSLSNELKASTKQITESLEIIISFLIGDNNYILPVLTFYNVNIVKQRSVIQYVKSLDNKTLTHILNNYLKEKIK